MSLAKISRPTSFRRDRTGKLFAIDAFISDGECDLAESIPNLGPQRSGSRRAELQQWEILAHAKSVTCGRRAAGEHGVLHAEALQLVAKAVAKTDIGLRAKIDLLDHGWPTACVRHHDMDVFLAEAPMNTKMGPHRQPVVAACQIALPDRNHESRDCREDAADSKDELPIDRLAHTASGPSRSRSRSRAWVPYQQVRRSRANAHPDLQ